MKKPTFDLMITGDICNYTLESIIKATEVRDDITIYLSSNGGSAEAAFAIKDYIEAHKINVTIYCGACVESAATVILSAGKQRYAYKSCMFMTHLPFAGMGSVFDAEKNAKKLGVYTIKCQALTPKIKLSHQPTYLTAKEALKEKIIDKIIT